MVGSLLILVLILFQFNCNAVIANANNKLNNIGAAVSCGNSHVKARQQRKKCKYTTSVHIQNVL